MSDIKLKINHPVTVNLHETHEAIEAITILGSELHILMLEKTIDGDRYDKLNKQLKTVNSTIQSVWHQLLTEHSKQF